MSKTMEDAHLNDYDVRMYDTVNVIPPCPYCGCDRIIVAHHSSWYENPVEYTVEHLDEKEAVTADCFDMYYAFKSVDDALSKASQYEERFNRILMERSKIEAKIETEDADGRA